MKMKNKMLLIAAVLVAGITVKQDVHALIPSNLWQVTEEDIYENNSYWAAINATVPEYFTVTIPKKLTIDKSACLPFEVKVEGDISDNSLVTVAADESFMLKDQAMVWVRKDDITAFPYQYDIAWDWEDAAEGNTKPGNVVITGLSAGEWKGYFNFNIEMIPVEFEGISQNVIKVSKDNISEYELVGDYYRVSSTFITTEGILGGHIGVITDGEEIPIYSMKVDESKLNMLDELSYAVGPVYVEYGDYVSMPQGVYIHNDYMEAYDEIVIRYINVIPK